MEDNENSEMLNNLSEYIKSEDKSNHPLAMALVQAKVVTLDFKSLVKNFTVRNPIPLRLHFKEGDARTRHGKKTVTGYFFFYQKKEKGEVVKEGYCIARNKNQSYFWWASRHIADGDDGNFKVSKIEILWDKYHACVDQQKEAKKFLKRVESGLWETITKEMKEFSEGGEKVPQALITHPKLKFKKLAEWGKRSNWINALGRYASLGELINHCINEKLEITKTFYSFGRGSTLKLVTQYNNNEFQIYIEARRGCTGKTVQWMVLNSNDLMRYN